jgi:hypothetical protein
MYDLFNCKYVYAHIYTFLKTSGVVGGGEKMIFYCTENNKNVEVCHIG